MKLIKHRKEKSGSLTPASGRLTPFWPMRRLQSEIDRLFEEPFGTWLTPDGPSLEGWMPAVDVLEDNSNVLVRAEIPGMKKEEFEVYLTGENLNIAGERKMEAQEKSANTHRRELYFGTFHRSVPLPAPGHAALGRLGGGRVHPLHVSRLEVRRGGAVRGAAG